jgi:predicted dehydrogenase
MTRIALIGLGFIGGRHLGVLLGDTEAYEVAGIADPSPAAATLAAEKGLKHFAGYEEMLDAAKPDGVIVATPNRLHVESTLACVKRGIPVLLEKPVADTIGESLKIVETAEAAKVPLLVGHHRRHHPVMRKAADAIHADRIGDVTAVSCMWFLRKHDKYFTTWRAQEGGGPVLLNAIHDIDCLRMLCGDIVSVQAATANKTRKLVVEDTAATILTFANGALGTLIVTDTSPSTFNIDAGTRDTDAGLRAENSYFIAGTKASISLPSLEIFRHKEPGGSWTEPHTSEQMSYTTMDPYVEQMRNFAAVIAGTEKPVVSGREGLLTLAVTLAIHESAKTGKPVRIDDLLARR